MVEYIQQKQCTHKDCQKWYPATSEFFHLDKNRKDGLSLQCKVCKREYDKSHQILPEVQAHRKATHLLRNPPKPKEQLPDGRRRCTVCEQILPATLEFFRYERNRKDGLQPRCKKCINKPPVIDTIPEGTKRCTKCKAIFAATLEFFSHDKNKKDGLFSQCKVCRRAYNKAHHHKPEVRERYLVRQKAYYRQPGNRERHRAYNKAYYSQPENIEHRKSKSKSHYEESKHSEDFQRKRQVYRSRPDVQERKRERGKAYRSQPEYRERQAVYLKAYGPLWRSRPGNRDRARVYVLNRIARKRAVPGSHTPKQSQEQYDRQKGKCYWCKQKVMWGKHHEDHIIPLSRENSSNDISNIVITCPTCNIRRGNKLPHEAYEFGRLL